MAINFVQIGKHIGEIRKRRGLSQQKLSEIIDKSPTYGHSEQADQRRVHDGLHEIHAPHS